MFKTVMIILIVAVGLGWVAYGIWRYLEIREEKKHPQKKTEHLEKVRKSYADYIKKVEGFKKPGKPGPGE
jgi:uncharacterized membrane protein YidH (DUF202 family)